MSVDHFKQLIKKVALADISDSRTAIMQKTVLLSFSFLTDDFPGLRAFAPIVSVHPYCARKFTCHVIHRARTLRTKMNNDRADGHS